MYIKYTPSINLASHNGKGNSSLFLANTSGSNMGKKWRPRYQDKNYMVCLEELFHTNSTEYFQNIYILVEIDRRLNSIVFSYGTITFIAIATQTRFSSGVKLR